jgi:hypothetical protein
MYGPSRTGSGIADADALCSSLRNLPVEAAFVQVSAKTYSSMAVPSETPRFFTSTPDFGAACAFVIECDDRVVSNPVAASL